jgi:tetratricopeptide (TPR) repeat protein
MSRQRLSVASRCISGLPRKPFIAVSHGAIALGLLASGGMGLNLAPASAQAIDYRDSIDLNRQLTMYLNSGSRSLHRDRGDELVGLGKTSLATGNLAQAIAQWRQALVYFQAAGDTEAMAQVYGYLSAAYSQTEQTAAKEDALRRQLAATRDLRDFSSQIYATNALGRELAPRVGGSPAAAQLFSEGMTVASSLRHEKGEYWSGQNMDWLANSLDQPDGLTRRVEYAFLPSNQWVANPVSYATKLNQTSDRKLLEQRYYAATRVNRTADQLARQANDAALQLQAIDNLVAAYRAMGRYDLASDWLEQRLQLAQTILSPQEELATLTTLGQLNAEIGRIPAAQRYYQQAMTVAQTLDDTAQKTLIQQRLNTINTTAN